MLKQAVECLYLTGHPQPSKAISVEVCFLHNIIRHGLASKQHICVGLRMELADQERWAAEQEVQVNRVRQLLQQCLSRSIRVTLVIAQVNLLC